jgi:hypothetical protein
LAGYRVIILVHRGANLSQLPALPPEITVLTIVPAVGWREDVISDNDADMLMQSMDGWFQVLVPTPQRGGPIAGIQDAPVSKGGTVFEPLHIIALDLLFQSWFVTFAKAIHKFCAGASPVRHRLRWYHTAHSSVGARPVTIHPDAKFLGDRSAVFSADDEVLARARWYRCDLPQDHTLIALNYADVPHLAAYYATEPVHIKTLLNPKDVRPFARMSITTSQLTTKYGLHLADVTMIYPLSMERVQEKGIAHVLALLGAMKRIGATKASDLGAASVEGDLGGLTVRLLLITAHANGEKAKELIQWVKSVAESHGLVTEAGETASAGAEVILTCEAVPGTQASGLGADDVRALWSVSNLFIFPTVSEAGSLVLLEAALAGCTLVLNQSLPCLADYIPADQALWVPWGSLKGAGNPPTTIGDLDDLAEKVWDRMQEDRGGVLKRHIMRQHSLSRVGRLMQGAASERRQHCCGSSVRRQHPPAPHPEPALGSALDPARWADPRAA